MEIYERIRELRKKHLNLTQTEFAEKLGVTRSVINNIERNVLARPDQKEPFYRLICSTFNVNYEWLLSGTEPMFVETRDDYINQLVKRYNGSEVLKKVIAAFINLNDAERQAVLKFIENLEPEPTQKIWLAASSTDDQKPEIRNVPASKVRAAQEDTSIQTEDDI